MRIKSINLVWITVKDFKKAVKYYTDVVGLKLKEYHEEWGWAELEGHDGQGMRLGICQENETDPIQPGQNGVMTFTVENIEQSIKELQKNGAQLIGSIQEIPGQVKLQSVKDTEGNVFQLVEVLVQKKSPPNDKMKNSCCQHH